MADNLDTIASIGVISDLAADGTYLTTIQVGDDTVIPLPRASAYAYALAAIAAAEYAAYDAAVLAQVTKIVKGDKAAAAQMVLDLRADRAPLDTAATHPLAFEPIIASKTGEPAIHVSLRGTRFCQWTVDDLKGHALHVLGAAAAVDLDNAYYQLLTTLINVEPDRARNVVGDLINHRSE